MYHYLNLVPSIALDDCANMSLLIIKIIRTSTFDIEDMIVIVSALDQSLRFYIQY